MLTFSDLNALFERASSSRVLCVGDVMIDRYVYGEVDRVSPEAPIPVLAWRREMVMLGAAGNVARNLVALGMETDLIALVGEDQESAELQRLIAAERTMTGHLVSASDRRTTIKTRFVAGSQQLLRVDIEDVARPPGLTEEALVQAIGDRAKEASVVLLSDYAKGVVTEGVIAACRASGRIVIVDPKGRGFAKYGNVDVIKPNAHELSLTTQLPCRSDEEIEVALAAALRDCEARAIVVTRAAQGMSFAQRGKPVIHMRAVARQVFDVSGAGDTALAALGVALAAGASLETAVEVAILASGLVVGKVGTAIVTPQELIEAEMAQRLGPAESKIMSDAALLEAVANWRADGKTIGFTNGCFDILHRGHVSYLSWARAACDKLIVALNTDASIRMLKGDGRPVNMLESRALVAAGLSSVDAVTAFDAETPLGLIELIRPDVLIKGADYTLDSVVGADLVQGYGGRVYLAPIVDGYSTTAAIRRIKSLA